MQSEEVRNKAKETCMKLFGVENAAQSEIVKAKMKEMITVNEDEVRAQEAILKVLKKKNMELAFYQIMFYVMLII